MSRERSIIVRNIAVFRSRLVALSLGIALCGAAFAQDKGEMPLQPLAKAPGQMNMPGVKGKAYYVPSAPDTIMWGYLPNAESKPVLTVPSGATVVFDTVSHEGILEDQGRDPVKYFSAHGVPGT